jgi:cytochrome P450
MAAEVEGPGIDWFAAQPYDGWGKARRSECPVIASEEIAMGPGTTYQITAWKDADAVLRDDKTFASFINMQHIGEFMGELIVGMDGDEHRTYRNLVAKAFARRSSTSGTRRSYARSSTSCSTRSRRSATPISSKRSPRAIRSR